MTGHRPSFLLLSALLFSGTVLGSIPAAAQVTGFSGRVVPQDEVPAFVTCDVLVSFTGQLTGVQLLVELTSGSIFQQPVLEGGGDRAPSPGFFGVFPAAEFDTFITLGGADRISSDTIPGFAGGAVNLGGQSTRTFDESLIDVAFFPPGGAQILDQTEYMVARLTLSDDAFGEISVLASANGVVSDPVVIGLEAGLGFCIPEPTTAALIGTVGLALLRRPLAAASGQRPGQV